jgi:hypothetical protein
MAYRNFPIALKLHWTGQDVFGDLRVRYGIKLGLAGLLALFCTQVLRLPHDNWAILTVLVLMSARFVGSIAVKAIMRVVGTIAGALVGVWLVGDYTSTPAIFLAVLFLVIALASYKFGQFGARQTPYAYFLLGLTTLTVATDGGHGSGTSMADRPRSIGGDFGRNYELASGNKRALAPLRAGRVPRSRKCCTENG